MNYHRWYIKIYDKASLFRLMVNVLGTLTTRLQSFDIDHYDHFLNMRMRKVLKKSTTQYIKDRTDNLMPIFYVENRSVNFAQK